MLTRCNYYSGHFFAILKDIPSKQQRVGSPIPITPLTIPRKQEGKSDDEGTAAVELCICLTYNLLFPKRLGNQALRIIAARDLGGINLAQRRSEVRCYDIVGMSGKVEIGFEILK